MEIRERYGWRITPAEAVAVQRELAGLISRRNEVAAPRFVAGVDISVGGGEATAAVVVMKYPELEPVETEVARGSLNFPYVPGLLSFRESPLALAAFAGLTVTPDLVLVDGQGLAHPRRFGFACHLGLLLDTPTIGCAKSRLCGTYREPGNEPGSHSELRDGEETIGAVLRTRAGVKPVYVSVGHKVDLETAVTWVSRCCLGYRLPEPCRLAHHAAIRSLHQQQQEVLR